MAEYVIKNLESEYEPVVGFLDLETPREEELIKDFIDQTQIEYSIQENRSYKYRSRKHR